jgi:hypothetical protein
MSQQYYHEMKVERCEIGKGTGPNNGNNPAGEKMANKYDLRN